MVVVLPAPLGPRKPNTSPRRTRKLTPASESTGALGYRLTRSATSTATPPDASTAGASGSGDTAVLAPRPGRQGAPRSRRGVLRSWRVRSFVGPVPTRRRQAGERSPHPRYPGRARDRHQPNQPGWTSDIPARPGGSVAFRARSPSGPRLGYAPGGDQGAVSMGGSNRWSPLRGVTRSWGHFVRRPRGTQIRTLAMVGAVLVGTGLWVATAPSSTSTAGASTNQSSGRRSGPTPVSKASTSSRGVSAHAINVVFPVVSLNSLAGKEGFAQDAEFGEQTKAIQLFVEADQPGRRDQRPQDQPDHLQLRPGQRDQHAGAVQDLDRGIAGGLRRAGRRGRLDRRQPAVHHPGGPDADDRAVDHGDQLDHQGLALPVVDRPRPGHPAPGGGQLGPELRPAGRQEGGGDRRGPGLGPAGPEAVPAARPQPGRGHPGRQDHRLGPVRHGHHRHPGPAGRAAAAPRRRRPR